MFLPTSLMYAVNLYHSMAVIYKVLSNVVGSGEVMYENDGCYSPPNCKESKIKLKQVLCYHRNFTGC